MRRENGIGEGRWVLLIVLLGIAAGFGMLLLALVVGS